MPSTRNNAYSLKNKLKYRSITIRGMETVVSSEASNRGLTPPSGGRSKQEHCKRVRWLSEYFGTPTGVFNRLPPLRFAPSWRSHPPKIQAVVFFFSQNSIRIHRPRGGGTTHPIVTPRLAWPPSMLRSRMVNGVHQDHHRCRPECVVLMCKVANVMPSVKKVNSVVIKH